MNDDRSFRERVYDVPEKSCFAAPLLDDASAKREKGLPKLYRGWNGGLPDGATGDPELDWVATTDPGVELAVFEDKELYALSRLVPSLLCGEESAVIIFQHEARRYGRKADEAMAQGLGVIAGEEERHELLLRALTAFLPTPDDLDDIHGRATEFFTRLGFQSFDPIHRLNHIGALDRCVCQVLGAMMKRATVTRSPVFSRIVERIRQDEARHVKICRGIMQELGVSKAEMAEADRTVREMFIAMMGPVGDAFEDIAVDPDGMFRTIRRETGY